MTGAITMDDRPGTARGRLAAVPDPPDPADLPPVGEQLRTAAERILVAVVDRLSAVALDKVENLAEGLERMARDGGPAVGAAVGAGKAWAQGRNLLWGAIKGGFAALGTAAKVLISIAVALAPVLLLVALVVLIVAALVWAVVAAVRAMAS